MSAKYANGQKVKIILVKNQHLNPKYEGFEFQKYVSQTGKVVDSQWVGMGDFQKPASRLDTKDYYFYTIRLDKDRSEIKAIPEDALEAIK